MADLDPIVDELARARQAAGYTLAQVAELCGVSSSHINRAENNLTSPSLYILRRWAAGLGYALVLIPRERPEVTGG